MQPLQAAFLTDKLRFGRIGESEKGSVGSGGFGTVFQGWDNLRNETVVIKRQKASSGSAAREQAAYRMWQAYPHPNILRMLGMMTRSHTSMGASTWCTNQEVTLCPLHQLHST